MPGSRQWVRSACKGRGLELLARSTSMKVDFSAVTSLWKRMCWSVQKEHKNVTMSNRR